MCMRVHELIRDNLKNMSHSNMEAWLFTVDSFFLVCISIPITASLLHRMPSPTRTSYGSCGAKDSEKRNSLQFTIQYCFILNNTCIDSVIKKCKMVFILLKLEYSTGNITG